jgi:hypothetical protein
MVIRRPVTQPSGDFPNETTGRSAIKAFSGETIVTAIVPPVRPLRGTAGREIVVEF